MDQATIQFDDELREPVITHPRDLPPTMSEDQQAYAEAAEVAFESDDTPSFEQVSAIGPTLLAEFDRAKLDRQQTELRWLMDLRQFKGLYEPGTFTDEDKNRSKAFVRKTRVKVKTVDAKITDLLFPANAQRNWSIDPTPNPTVAPEQRQDIAALLGKSMGQSPTEDQIDEAVRQSAENASKAMSKTVDDQLVEARYKSIAKLAIHSGNLYGTGIIKGPLVERKARQRFVREKITGNGPNVGKFRWVMKTEYYIAPFVEFVPLWHFYPDMTATTLEACRYVYELHPMTRERLISLAKRPSFDSETIKAYVAANPDGNSQTATYDVQLRQMGERTSAAQNQTAGIYDVLERWGWLTGQQLKECGVKDLDGREVDSFFTNVWLLPTGEVIRAAIQPIAGVLWPYHLYYLDKDETSIFGEGIASIMRDDQSMLNAGVRMMLDNAAITAGPQIEANTGLLNPGQDPRDIRPFKVWTRTNEDSASPAIRVSTIPNSLPELSQIIGMFEANADETTAVPRYVTGENVTQGAAGTASGLSMLMGNSAIVFKDQVSNWDEGVTIPFITSLYRWNMQFSPDEDVKGDYDVNANGAASLVAKEVRGQQLAMFGQSTANPLDAPFIKRDVLNRQRADALDLVDVVKSKEEVEADQNNEMAQAQAQLAQQQQQIVIQQAAAQVANLNAQAEKTMREAQRILAEAVRVRAVAAGQEIENARAAFEAGGMATSNPHAAAAGDQLLQHAGQETDQTLMTLAQMNGTQPPSQPQQPGAQQ